jgi:uncharacterized protein YkwD
VLEKLSFFTKGKLFFQLLLFLVLVIIFLLGGVFKKTELYKKLPLLHEAAVFSLVLPSPLPKSKPKPMPVANVAQKNVETVPDEKKVLAGSTSDSLCQGKKDSWTMVPDPAHEGLYTICNVTTEKMATVDELNSVQNDYRRSHGLNALNINSGLCRIAGERAQEISKNFSHDGFEAAIKRSGLANKSFGENIASGPLDAVHFVEWSWDRSPGHKANMLGDWTDGCAGVWDKYAVFMFAK